MLSFEQALTNPAYQEIERLADIIWREHYIPIIGLEQVEYMLDKFQSLPVIAKQVADGVEYHLIKKNSLFVGYVSFYQQEDALFLSKIYVLNQQRGKGVGKASMQLVFDKAVEYGFKTIRLTVNKYNSNTIAAYKKIGFKQVDSVVADIGGGYVMDDFVMEFTLN